MKIFCLGSLFSLGAVSLALFSFVTFHSVSASCLPNSDWPNAPCYAIAGLNVTKEQMQKDWTGFYHYKGAQWMEMKRSEMTNATTNRILKAWVCSSQSNYDAWWYYYLNGQAPSIAWQANGPMCDIPPLQQLKVGTKTSDIECTYDRYLLVNKKTGMPACVKLKNIPKFLGIGWEHLATYLDDTIPHSHVITKISILEQDLSSCKLCEGKSENLTVAIGPNNTVRWVNNTPSPIWFIAIPNGDDKAFYDSTLSPLVGHIDAKFPVYLDYGQGFEYTFTKPGKFFWHTNPQFMGWVTVLSPVNVESKSSHSSNLFLDNENKNSTSNNTHKVTGLEIHSFGGSIRLGSDDSFNETEYYTGNVGDIIAKLPVHVSVSNPYDMFIHEYDVPSSSIMSDGSFNFTHTFLGKFGQDTYTLDFTYGTQKYELKFIPVIPP